MFHRQFACTITLLVLLLCSSVVQGDGLEDGAFERSHPWQEALRKLVVHVQTTIWGSTVEPTNPVVGVTPVHVMLYETEVADENSSHADSLLSQLSRLPGVQATIFGQGTGFEGFGSKYSAVYPLLQSLRDDSLVVISDSRDVLINSPVHVDAAGAQSMVDEFIRSFTAVTDGNPDAIVLSAEAQCCVSALTYVLPGDYYHTDGSRHARACASGEDGCLWAGDAQAVPWQEFMQTLAAAEAANHHPTATTQDDIYLNAGLIMGTARNLMRVIQQAQIGKDEDDQAVLTDFMYTNPGSILLDYGQTLFGNNRGGLGGLDTAGSCVFDVAPMDHNQTTTTIDAQQQQQQQQQLVHTKTHTTPLFLHSPGGYFDCQDELALKLGLFREAAVESVRVHRRLTKKSHCNYGGDNYRGCRDGHDDDEQYIGEDEALANDSGRKRVIRRQLRDTVEEVRGALPNLRRDGRA